jgi:hypothetical protein
VGFKNKIQTLKEATVLRTSSQDASVAEPSKQSGLGSFNLCRGEPNKSGLVSFNLCRGWGGLKLYVCNLYLYTQYRRVGALL